MTREAEQRDIAVAALNYIGGQAGIPDPLEACRQIIATCKRTLARLASIEATAPPQNLPSSDAEREAQIRQRAVEGFDKTSVEPGISHVRLDRVELLRLLDEARAEIACLKDANDECVRSRCKAPYEDEYGEHSCEPPDCRPQAPPGASAMERANRVNTDPSGLRGPAWHIVGSYVAARAEIARVIERAGAEARAEPQSGWRPIETAPETFPHKGGRPIDIWADGKRFAACFQLERYSGWWQVNPYGGPIGLPPQVTPTHWLPPPEPPPTGDAP